MNVNFSSLEQLFASREPVAADIESFAKEVAGDSNVSISSNFDVHLHDRDIEFTVKSDGKPSLIIRTYPEHWEWPSPLTVIDGYQLLASKEFKYVMPLNIQQVAQTESGDKKIVIIVVEEDKNSATIKDILNSVDKQSEANKMIRIFGKALAEIHQIDQKFETVDWEAELKTPLNNALGKLKGRVNESEVRQYAEKVVNQLKGEKRLVGTMQGHAHLGAFSYNNELEKVSVRESSDLGTANGNPNRDYVTVINEINRQELRNLSKEELVQHFTNGYCENGGTVSSGAQNAYTNLKNQLNVLAIQVGRTFDSEDESRQIGQLIDQTLADLLASVN